jgi:DNA-binding transcriptional regulator YiaG
MSERCPKGHDRRVVGTLSDGTCRECSLATRRRYRARVRAGQPVAFKNPICPKGHDKRVVGTTSGMCSLCCAAINRERMRRWRKVSGRTPTTVPNLRAVRQALGVSFKEFARFAGISESHLANLETGKRRASRKMQRRLVAAVARLRVKHPERWERIKEIAG